MSPSVSLIVLSISKKYLGKSQLWRDVSEMVIGCQVREMDVGTSQSSIWSSLILSYTHSGVSQSEELRWVCKWCSGGNAFQVSPCVCVSLLLFSFGFSWVACEVSTADSPDRVPPPRCRIPSLMKFHCKNKPTTKIKWYDQVIIRGFFRLGYVCLNSTLRQEG